jgi:predicted porin
MPSLFNIQASIKNYQAYAMKAAEIVNKLQGRIKYYDNQKQLNDYQEKTRKEAEEVTITFMGLQKCAREMIGHFEEREADA